MKVFIYPEARQNLSKLIVLAQNEEVEIRRKDGSVFVLRSKRSEFKSSTTWRVSLTRGGNGFQKALRKAYMMIGNQIDINGYVSP